MSSICNDCGWINRESECTRCSEVRERLTEILGAEEVDEFIDWLKGVARSVASAEVGEHTCAYEHESSDGYY